MRVIGVLWTIAAWWFIASVISAPLFLAVRAARGRGRRLFVDEPNERVDHLAKPPAIDHRWDA